MATLPQVTDYGSRVKLSSNRIDLPGQGEMAVANALERAAGTFVDMAIQHKEKDDALSYSNAKNDYLIADIQEREKLQDDQDFATHDERYRVAMRGHYDRLFPTVRSKRDQSLFDAEARLMNERGSVAVGDNSRTKEIDWNVAKWQQNGIDTEAVIMSASDAQTAQAAMLGFQEQGVALRDRGMITNEELQATNQKYVSGISYRRLVAMDPKEREIHLERSILMTKTKGEPITPDQIYAGEGSGSMADFIPLDVRVKMLEETKTANERDGVMDEAYAVFDEVTARYTDPVSVDRALREAGKGRDSKVRSELRTLGMQYRQDQAAVEVAVRDNIMASSAQLMREEGWTYDRLPSGELAKLAPAQDAALRAYSRMIVEGKPFADATLWVIQADGRKSYAAWRALRDDEKALVDLQSPEWLTVLTGGIHKDLVDEQDRIKNATTSTRALPSGLTNVQMVTSAIVRTGLVPQTGRDVEQYEQYQRLLYEFDRATQVAQDAKGAALTNTERNRILGEVMTPMAFTDDWTFYPNKDEDDMIPIAAMSTKQLKSARLPYDQAAEEVASTSSAGINTTYLQELELMASKLKPPVDPDKDDYERAYFALKHGLGSEEVKRRLRNE